MADLPMTPREVLREELEDAPHSKGVKRYFLRQPHYRQGHYYPAGVVIEVPAKEKKSVAWELVDKHHPAAGMVPYAAPPLPEPRKDGDTGPAAALPTGLRNASVGHDNRGPEYDPKPVPIPTTEPAGGPPKKK